jgi:hypothetical protein
MNGKVPSQALNPKENVNAFMLRSGKELEEQGSKQIEMEEEGTSFSSTNRNNDQHSKGNHYKISQFY